jgi:hypothetical protein
MTACEGMEVQLHTKLTYALDGGKWSTSYPLTPGERSSGTHYVWGWIEPRADVEGMKKKKIIYFLCRGSNCDSPASSP